MKTKQSTIFEISKPGRFALDLPKSDVPAYEMETLVPANLLRSKYAQLPEVSQPDLIRHYTALSKRNFGVDSGFYPLGSCTMKYNPKVNEDVCRYPGFADIHPLQDVESTQGALELLYQMEQYLADSAHGTNPATATVCGLEIVEIKSNDDGSINLDALKAAVGLDTAAFMLTNPSTLGLFEKNIKEIAQIVHAAGGLLYYDGANTNAVMGIVRPGDMGFDVVHINLHKTFSTPHGGGGPGSGPVGVKQELIPFLPVPIVTYDGKKYDLEYDRPLSIGRMHSFYGNFGVIVRAYAYIRTMGPDGLRQASEDAVLNANYCLSQLREDYYAPFDRYSMHECIITSKNQKQFGVKTLDIAKRLLDYGYHPPTIYFPLIVEEAIMIEPTETESKETLDGFIKAMREIAKEARTDVTQILNAPHDTVVGRLDETAAARKPVVRWKP